MALARRPLRVGHAVLFVVAVAVGLGLARAASKAMNRNLGDLTGPPYDYWRFNAAMTGAAAVASCLTIALVASHLGRDRPRLRSLLRRPGFVSCAAVCIAQAYALAASVPEWAWVASGRRSSNMGWIDARIMLLHVVGEGSMALVVASAWGLQALAGRWRAEPSWRDRAGRLLGAYWLVAGPVSRWCAFLVFG